MPFTVVLAVITLRIREGIEDALVKDCPAACLKHMTCYSHAREDLYYCASCGHR